MTMTTDLRNKWIAALRSGVYQQTTAGYLHLFHPERGHCYCALGVLCDIIAPEEWTIYHEFPEKRGGGYYDWTRHGVGNTYGELEKTIGSEVLNLITLNDGTPTTPPRSFPEIADWIEQNVRGN